MRRALKWTVLWMRLLKDMIPFYHVSAGVRTVSCGMYWCSHAFCIMVAGNEQLFL